MGSALLNPAADGAANASSAHTVTETPEELRREVAARLAAHRERRLRRDTQPVAAGSAPGSAQDGQKARIAAVVAERYQKAQSYRAFLAAEAESAVQQARAAAEVAARNAQALAAAQQELLSSLAEQDSEQASGGEQDSSFGSFADQTLWPDLDESVVAAAPDPEPPLRVVLYDRLPSPAHDPAPLPRSERQRAREAYQNDPEALALDEEISFRQSPVFEEPPGPPMPLPANLIEFPRQLVAARKARPRYAEGPLREDASQPTGLSEQLRIFEVHPGQISTTPDVTETAAALTPEAQWTSIWLDTPGQTAVPAPPDATVAHIAEPSSYVFSAPKLYPAKISRRVLAGSIDLAFTALAGFGCAAGFVVTMGAIGGHAPFALETLRATASELLHTVPAGTLAISGVVALFFLSVLLQVVCFTFSEATPGMRLARIGLCTFSDENPTRAAMRKRIPALLLSTAVLGLGFGWALVDEDRLTWHDLISRMYPRSY